MVINMNEQELKAFVNKLIFIIGTHYEVKLGKQIKNDQKLEDLLYNFLKEELE
jgi:hypothetical protein